MELRIALFHTERLILLIVWKFWKNVIISQNLKNFHFLNNLRKFWQIWVEFLPKSQPVTALVNSYHELRFFGQKECRNPTAELFVTELVRTFLPQLALVPKVGPQLALFAIFLGHWEFESTNCRYSVKFDQLFYY